jgi:hypothetical protein
VGVRGPEVLLAGDGVAAACFLLGGPSGEEAGGCFKLPLPLVLPETGFESAVG